MASLIAAMVARSSKMSVKQMAEILYMYDMQVIAEAREFADKLLYRKRREEVEYDYSFADEYFSIFN